MVNSLPEPFGVILIALQSRNNSVQWDASENFLSNVMRQQDSKSIKREILMVVYKLRLGGMSYPKHLIALCKQLSAGEEKQ